jgi:hypothetical protein
VFVDAPMALWYKRRKKRQDCRMAKSRKKPVDRRDFLKGAAAGAAALALNPAPSRRRHPQHAPAADVAAS